MALQPCQHVEPGKARHLQIHNDELREWIRFTVREAVLASQVCNGLGPITDAPNAYVHTRLTNALFERLFEQCQIVLIVIRQQHRKSALHKPCSQPAEFDYYTVPHTRAYSNRAL